MMKSTLRWLLMVTLLGLLLVACSGAPIDSDRTPLTFVVDTQVTPSLQDVEGLEEGDPPRPTAAVLSAEGEQMDFVLGELIVSAESEEALKPFLTRWNAHVVDTFEPDEFSDPDDPIDFLVRLDPEGADTSRLASDLLKLEPEQQGEYRVSSQAALALLAVAMYEVAHHGLEVSINDVSNSNSFPRSATNEAPGHDAFQWPYMNIGSAQNIGVAAAWQLLAEEGKLPPVVAGSAIPIMIHDGGFILNNDRAHWVTIRRADWGDTSRMTCGSSPCPWHGTDVAMAAMARPDNHYGAAGPAGPIAQLIAVGAHPDRWKRVKQLRETVAAERPKIINMSYVANISFDKSGVRRRHNRHYKAMWNSGALLFASAGNEGRNADSGALILPCESTYVICVGGMGWDTTQVHPNSNYGTNPNKSISESVELYGPYEVYSIANPENPDINGVRQVRGTSFSSPFVAGVAALVWYANPDLTSNEVRAILRETAHRGGLGNKVTGHQLRVNAFGAVSYALGYQEWPAPTISISATSATGSVVQGFPLGEEIWFEADAKDHRGEAVPKVTWSIMGEEIETQPGFDGKHLVINNSLRVGTYTITATATDLGGHQATAELTIEVTYEPPEVFIVQPRANDTIWANEPLLMVGQGISGYFSLPANQVSWRVTSGGATVHSASGYATTVPAHVMQPGNYTIMFSGHDNVETSDRAIAITAIEKPAYYPTVTITSPMHGSTYADGALIAFSASATDPEDGVLDGTYFRWTASYGGGEVVLCEGNNFIGQALPVTNCGNFLTTLHAYQLGEEGTIYAVTVEAKDTDGHVDPNSVSIRVVIPPVP